MTLDYQCLIIGAGMSGVCLAIRLMQSGIEDFVLLEKAQDVGGVWRENTYPDAGCDVPSFLYSYSFAPNTEWTYKYARQPEIQAYFQRCAEQFQVTPHIRFGTEVTEARWDEEHHLWRVQTADGSEYTCRFLVTAVGQLSRPYTPQLPGAEDFRGPQWHSAQWNHEFDLRGKKVAVIGSGASAVQFVPPVTEAAEHVYLIQRSPNWIHLRDDYKYPNWARWCFRHLPGAARLHREYLYWRNEIRIFVLWGWQPSTTIYNWYLRREMKSRIKPELHDVLIPTYQPGCKRILISSNFLESVQRDNVTIITRPLTSITRDGFQAGDETYSVDAFIYGTGFRADEIIHPIKVYGVGNRTLDDAWRTRPHTLYGIVTPEFPNLFMLYGPNTNLGHNSIIAMVECQVNYLLQCIGALQDRGQSRIEVRAEAVQRFDDWLQRRLSDTAWADNCTNWYRNSAGAIVNNWSSSVTEYAWATRRMKPSDFKMQ